MTNRLENIGSIIRNERIRKRLTQEELGERVGVGKAQISKIESGKGLTIKTVTKGARCPWHICFCCFKKRAGN